MDYFSSLPEGCISEILSFTSPRDVCRSAATSQGVNLAADSDSVWGRFLPSDYGEIISRSISPLFFSTFTKKKLFLELSRCPILIDDGNLSFGLDRESGKKCYMLGARSLAIVWADSEADSSYWSWTSSSGSRFAEAAQLNYVCWLEIKGTIDTRILSWKTTYVAYLVFKLTERNSGLDGLELKASVRFVHEGFDQDDDHEFSIVYFSEYTGHAPHRPLNGNLARYRSDGWKEIELGEFECNEGNDGEVHMRLLATDGYSWKSGLIVQGIELRPKVLNI